MKDITLLILAAGMGSRYGGLKQLAELGPNGETIMDYSVDDAIAAGFTKVVFVIRKSMQEAFEAQILSKYKHKIKCEYVYQELDSLPEGFHQNPEREKPYGTAHAILVAKDAIKEPFAVINADDFYSRKAFVAMADFLRQPTYNEKPVFAMIGYQLKNTLSEHGTVARGVCQANENRELVSITEMTKIQRIGNTIQNTDEKGTVTLTGDEPVSMNFWGFTPYFFTFLNDLFVQFLKENNNNSKSEFPIPTAINYFITNRLATIKIIDCDAVWFGVTYQEDKPLVMERLALLS
ncbi:MAG: sugar phosphate nucleotidyltransferase [Bacteroidetes bacterium]|nr:sugar phosphate nucleotidyltransferase [Bacteroidota bacterium]MCL2303324.1 sugar phosphate nucleotidyltransferase [Lentimicrobiaceae bacterium]